MLVQVKVPALSESVAEATLLSWHKKQGEFVKRDENLIDIETDKVVLELPAPESGVLTKIVKADGGSVVANEVIAEIDTEAKGAAAAPAATEQPAKAAAPVPARAASASDTVIVMPAARKIAADKGIDAASLKGTGRGGRVTKEDVLTAGQGAPVPQAPAKPVSRGPSPVNIDQVLGDRPEQRVPMSRLRKRVAERLLESQSNAAILTTFNEVNMQPVMELRKRLRDDFEKNHGVRLGFMSFFAKAAVQALQKFPAVNAYIEDNEIVYHDYCDIGVAVGSPRGLLVPIVRNVEHMNFAEIEGAIADYGQRAQAGSIGIEELNGGTFTISNGGVSGSMLSTPILNPPQSAILGMHATQIRPVVENGEIVARPMMYLALSYDHRIVDGREAVQFLVTIKDCIEDPGRMLLGV